MELRNDLVHLKQEMTGISIVDEFSKYAKLQRKYNKLESTLKEKGKIKDEDKLKLNLMHLLKSKLDTLFYNFCCCLVI